MEKGRKDHLYQNCVKKIEDKDMRGKNMLQVESSCEVLENAEGEN